MPPKTDSSSSRARHIWLYGLTTILIAAAVINVALVSSQVTDSQSANVTATPRPPHLLDADARNMPIDDEDDDDVDAASSGKSSIGAFTVTGSFGYVTSGIWRNQWRHSMSWTRPTCDGCEITGYYFRLYKPSGPRYYSIRMGKRTSHNAYIANIFIAQFGTGTYRGVVKAVADNGEERFSNSLHFNVTHIPATRTPTPTATPTATATPSPTPTPTATATPLPLAVPVPTDAPDAPNAPAGEIKPDGSVYLTWNRISGAAAYDVRLWRNQQWLILPAGGISISFLDARAHVTGLPESDRHRFAVRAVNSAGNASSWSEPASFGRASTTLATPTTPTPVSADASNGSPTPTAEPTYECRPPSDMASTAQDEVSSGYENLYTGALQDVLRYEEALANGTWQAEWDIYTPAYGIDTSGDQSSITSFLDQHGLLYTAYPTRDYIFILAPIKLLKQISQLPGVSLVYIESPGGQPASNAPFSPTTPTPTATATSTSTPSPTPDTRFTKKPRKYPRLEHGLHDLVDEYEASQVDAASGSAVSDQASAPTEKVTIMTTGQNVALIAFAKTNNIELTIHESKRRVWAYVPLSLLGPMALLPGIDQIWPIFRLFHPGYYEDDDIKSVDHTAFEAQNQSGTCGKRIEFATLIRMSGEFGKENCYKRKLLYLRL